MTGAMSSRAAAVLVVVLCAAFTGVRASECANVSLTFCDNVNWAVDAEKRARADNIESMIQMSFYNQPGKWACKNEFKDLQCRIMFPQCSDNSDLGTNKAPCKKTCVDFSSRCPGADVSCDALSDDPNSCYDYDYAATTGNVQGGGLSGWPSVIICLVVLGAMVGIAKISKSMSPKKSFQAMNINSAANV